MLQGWKAPSTSNARRHGSFRKRRWNSTLPVIDVTSLPELLGAGQRFGQGDIIRNLFYNKFASVAASELIVMAPLSPVGKKPPCFAFACMPKARCKTWPVVPVAA